MSVTKNTLMPTYARKEITFVSGNGVWLTSDKQEKYLDALAGIAVCGLGHAHPEVAKAIADQASTLTHTSNIYRIELQEELGQKLCQLSGMDAVFFGNSGAEANEAAIKLARLHGHHKNISEPAIIVMEHSFHGRTMATLTATGNRKAHAGFEPLVPGFVRAPYNDVESVENILQNNTNISAILVEPIQGEGGIRIPESNYLSKLKLLCEKHEILLMLDEVQTGNGRTGKWFCFQHTNIHPDVLVTAKGLGNGVPIGACLTKGHAASLFAPGSHGSTFGGNPLACRASLATLHAIEKNKLLLNATNIGNYIVKELQEKLSTNKLVKEVRGKGLMIGIEMSIPCTELVDSCLNKKLLINVTAEKIIRLLPPLIFNKSNADSMIELLTQSINELSTTHV
ncbi:MAG: aspartate aminotransferase family protein [Gammaproteobacteria bacterium]